MRMIGAELKGKKGRNSNSNKGHLNGHLFLKLQSTIRTRSWIQSGYGWIIHLRAHENLKELTAGASYFTSGLVTNIWICSRMV